MNLISILISLCLSAVITNGTLQWYLFTKQEWKKTELRRKHGEIQKVIFQFIYQDLQAGGYRGLRSRDGSYPTYRQYCDYSADYRYFHFDRTVFGFIATPGNCFGKMPYTACERLEENTPVLIVYNVPYGLSRLTKSMSKREDPLVAENLRGIQENALVLISDHEQSDAFIATHIEGNVLSHQKILGKNKTAELSKRYPAYTEIMELQTVAYYLAVPERFKNHIKPNLNAEESYSLFRDDFLHPAQELVSGIKTLGFTYGLATSDSKTDSKTKLQYFNANEIKQWEAVKSVGVEIVIEPDPFGSASSFRIGSPFRTSSSFRTSSPSGSERKWETKIMLRNG